MTGREKLIAASRGGEVESKPTLAWFNSAKPGLEADGWILASSSQIPQARESAGDGCLLVAVKSPFGWAKEEGLDLMSALHANPVSGDEELSRLRDKTRMEIRHALDQGADGICYILVGAEPTQTTPMQYGGFLLELDREILQEFAGAVFNAVWVQGDKELYLEFVADLPCHALGWDCQTTGIHTNAIRPYREGAFFGDSPESDIMLLNQPPVSHLFAASQEASC